MTHWHGANAISVALLWREIPSFGTSWDFGVNEPSLVRRYVGNFGGKNAPLRLKNIPASERNL
jgi:hypothetical protein